MKYYLFDEISTEDMNRIEELLKQNCASSGIDKLYWVELPERYFNAIQANHKDCQPYLFPIEIGKDWIKAELFVRTIKDFSCDCSDYCTKDQREFILDYMDNIIADMNVST